MLRAKALWYPCESFNNLLCLGEALLLLQDVVLSSKKFMLPFGPPLSQRPRLLQGTARGPL
eukprot:457612-Amphidinium_carterae.1